VPLPSLLLDSLLAQQRVLSQTPGVAGKGFRKGRTGTLQEAGGQPKKQTRDGPGHKPACCQAC
jgi:hypothetical protein